MRGNPQARHYHNIAHRRAEERGERDRIEFLAAGGRRDPVKAVKMVVGIREREEFGCEIGGVGGRRVRPLEDPELVGESAADMARRERLRREGMEVLEREDMRWDWFLCEYSLKRREHHGYANCSNSTDGGLATEREGLEGVCRKCGEDEEGEACCDTWPGPACLKADLWLLLLYSKRSRKFLHCLRAPSDAMSSVFGCTCMFAAT